MYWTIYWVDYEKYSEKNPGRCRGATGKKPKIDTDNKRTEKNITAKG